MEELLKNVAYLKGLADGLKLEEKSDEGKVLIKIIDCLDEMAEAINDLAADQDDLFDQIDAIDEDLAEVEDIVYDEDEYDDYEDDDEDDIDFFEVECPNCHETVYIDEEYFDEDSPMVCPNCNKEIELDFSACDGDCAGCSDCE